MSLRSSQSFPGASVEGQTVTNWRLIWITTALEVVFVAGLFVTWRLLPHPKPRPEMTTPGTSMARERRLPAPLARIVPTASTHEKSESSSGLNAVAATTPPPSAGPRPGRPAAQQASAKPAKIAPSVPKPQSRAERSAPIQPKKQLPATNAPPERVETIPVEEFRDPPLFKRINFPSENQLTELFLSKVPEVDIDTVKKTSAQLMAQGKEAATLVKVRTVLDLISERADLGGLPMRNGADCQTPADKAKELQAISRIMRPLIDDAKKVSQPGLSYGMVAYFAETLAHEMRGGIFEASTDGDGKSRPTSSSARLRAKGITTIVQLLQGEELPFRLALVRLLAGTPSREASVALAQRTLFDTSEYIREEAVTALKSRPAAECRPILLEGLRYPWAPVADHAAEALVALRDKEAISNLVDLLELSDPAAPVERADSKWIKPQLVRINHLRNCLLCHSPSFDRKDLVRGPVPTRSEPLPRIYYANFKGPAIRADVTYLRQDFSVLQNVPEPGKWPERQRFDYVIRQRELTSDELRAYQAAERSAARIGGLRTYPQRQAVLFALRELTGKDAGASALAWRRLIPGMMNTFGRKPKT